MTDHQKNWLEAMSLIDKLRGALADIAVSDDMTLKIARAKARRIYDETRNVTEALQSNDPER